MGVNTKDRMLELPDGTRSKLEAFKRQVWIVKLAEGVLAGFFGLLVSYLFVFALDRFWETPISVRLGILILGCLGFGFFFPLKCHRWIWKQRRLEQVARLLRHKFPRLGDQLLGIIELAQSQSEQQRSATLIRAAMKQVDQVTAGRDFTSAVPNPQHRNWAWATGLVFALFLGILFMLPDAGKNALARWLMPWRNIDRYTFAKLDDLKDEMVVPFAEPFTLNASLAENTEWTPKSGVARYESQPDIVADLSEGAYSFAVPPQKENGKLAIAIGDARKRINISPMTRPELKEMVAEINLPKYLERKDQPTHDVRGGSATLVKGSKAVFKAKVSRELATAEIDGGVIATKGDTIVSPVIPIEGDSKREFVWSDIHGLSAKEPFVLNVKGRDDEAPNLMCENIMDGQVVLQSEVLSIDVRASDDFGVKQIGMEWQGIEDAMNNPVPDKGEKVVAVGSPESEEIAATAAFSADRLKIDPQVIRFRLFAVDYLPDRERIYSPTYHLFVLSPEEHAIYLTEQLRKWHRQSQEVYEHEQQLFETNKQIRDLPSDQLDRPETRRQIENQAIAERANSHRLSALTEAGEGLIKEAMKNDQFNVATLEKWAEMVQQLKDIADNKMPSVADLLKEAANAPGAGQPGQQGEGKPGQGKPGQGTPGQGNPSQDKAQPGQGEENKGESNQTNPGDGEASPKSPSNSDSKSAPQVGEQRDGRTKPGDAKPPEGESPPKAPTVVDGESGYNKLDEDEEKKDQPPSNPGSGKLTLPSTTINGGPMAKSEGDPQPPPPPAKFNMDEAVKKQEELLAAFAKVADELKKILGNLEASTFVKRFKAASRRQVDVASDLNKTLNAGFGVSEDRVEKKQAVKQLSIARREVNEGESIYTIQDDLEAYFNRVQEGKFRTVLQEMKDSEVVTNVKKIAATIEDNHGGQSIAEAELWADALDRWAEQLVGPG